LLERFKRNSDSIVSELESSIISKRDVLTKDQIIQTTISKSNADKKVFGHNFWKSVLEIELANTSAFIDTSMKI